MIAEAQPVDHPVHCFATRRKALTVNAHLLQRSPQALGRRVVPTICSAAHRTAHAVTLEQVLKLDAAILTPTVAVHDRSGLRPTPEPRHSQHARNQLCAHVRLERPSRDPTTEQIPEDDRQVQPTLVGPEIGDVCRPGLIGFRPREVTLQQIRRDRQIVLAVGLGFEALRLVRTLMPCSFMSRRTRPLLTRMPCASSFFRARGQPYSPLDSAWMARMWISSASLLMRRRGPIMINIAGLTVAIPTGTDAQRLAGHGNRPLSAMSFDSRALHTALFAKYAVAFRWISRSIFTWASSARNRAISICSADTCLPAPLSLPASSALIHVFNVCVLMPESSPSPSGSGRYAPCAPLQLQIPARTAPSDYPLPNPPLLKFYTLSVTDTFFEGKVRAAWEIFHQPVS